MKYLITFRVTVKASNKDDAERLAIQEIAETANYTMEIESIDVQKEVEERNNDFIRKGEKMKVYLVNKHYDNGEYYEDRYERDCVDKIFATEERALTYINDLKPEDMNNSYDDDMEDMEFKWEEESPKSYKPRDTIRSFCRKVYDDVYETYDYSISEREVEE